MLADRQGDASRIRKLIKEGKFSSSAINGYGDKSSQMPVTPLAIIQFERKDQRRICDALELCADQLAGEVDFSLYESINEKLRFNLPIYHRNEEALFDCLIRITSIQDNISPIMNYVCHEHATHNCYADELHQNWEVLPNGSVIGNPDTIGYMLRSCFETIRRHLAWEDLTLMPLALRLLTTQDLNELSEKLAENRKAISLYII
jgi:hemerythrin-like domain-containing protein